MTKRSFAAVAFALFAVLAAGCGGARREAPTRRRGSRCGSGWCLTRTREGRGGVRAAREYLSGELGTEVELSVPASYSAVVEAMASGELDLAYFGG
ncbi:PhnD/SsuA/transferrin family substrate-binding protein [Rubrobacter marinus]|uniref:PhnD/SsuA/transferrin family substrate-binding protein n=1 Tax=Rubrobacter marinus TaxID=2653852 RepID=A0A6G8PYM5_9ACTN|nr:PhnD/SsuA/transferrin family substrate-binding protein [Rubrobacter marinus]